MSPYQRPSGAWWESGIAPSAVPMASPAARSPQALLQNMAIPPQMAQQIMRPQAVIPQQPLPPSQPMPQPIPPPQQFLQHMAGVPSSGPTGPIGTRPPAGKQPDQSFIDTVKNLPFDQIRAVFQHYFPNQVPNSPADFFMNYISKNFPIPQWFFGGGAPGGAGGGAVGSLGGGSGAPPGMGGPIGGPGGAGIGGGFGVGGPF